MAPNGPLAKVLRHIHGQALLYRGARQRHTLPHGLVIELYVEQDGTEHLAISRDKAYPSDQEWATVLRNWPHARIPPELLPGMGRTRLSYFLAASWMPLPHPEITDA